MSTESSLQYIFGQEAINTNRMRHSQRIEQPSSAAEMIRRFREAKPTSQVERQQVRKKGMLREMWWVDNKEPHATSSNIGKDQDYGYRGPSNSVLSEDTTPAPRPSPLKPRPHPPPKPFSQISSHTSLSHQNAIDDEIFNEIAHLSMDKSLQRELSRGHELLTSLDHPRHSLEKSLERRLRRQQEDDEIPAYRFHEGAPSSAVPHHSLESLGFSLKGLLFPELQLDGKEQPPEEPAPTGQVTDIHANLEELLKSLAVDKELRTEDGMIATIPQVFNKINADMMTFISRYTEKYAEEEAEAAERKAHDELMKEEGRKEERERLLKEMKFARSESDDLLEEEEEIWGYPESKDDDDTKKRLIASLTESATEMRLDQSIQQLRRNHGRFHFSVHTSDTKRPHAGVRESAEVESSMHFEPNHETIAKAAESITSTMQVCLDLLHLRLPEIIDETPAPPQPALPAGVPELHEIVPTGTPPPPAKEKVAPSLQLPARIPVTRDVFAEMDDVLGVSVDDMSFPTERPKPPKYSDLILAQRQAKMHSTAMNIARDDQPFYPHAPPAYNPNIAPSAPPQQHHITFHRDENTKPQVNIPVKRPVCVELKPPPRHDIRSHVPLPKNIVIPNNQAPIHEREKFLENMRKMRTGFENRHTIRI